MSKNEIRFLNRLHQAHEQALREQLEEGRITKAMYYAQCGRADKARREIMESGGRRR